MTIEAYITSINFKGGLAIDLAQDSIVIILGPNNCGKSTTLSDIKGILSNDDYEPRVVEEVPVRRLTDLAEIRAMLSEFRQNNGVYQAPGHSFHEQHLHRWWTDGQASLGGFLGSRIISDLTTRQRLSDCDPPQTFDSRIPLNNPHPFQLMFYNDELERQTSSVVRRAFKLDFIIHRSGGSKIPAYVGVRPVTKEGEDRVSRAFLDRVERLQKLEDQGDGIRSFVSIVGRVMTESRPIQLIDEPEAFLHPPQARLISEIISTNSGGRQTFIATHSSDIVRGLVAQHSDRVSIVRLTRSESASKASYLPNNQIKELWSNPLLRFGNVLDGLFHEGVIVTEGDADCRFYDAIATASIPPEFCPDIFYTYSGGKERISMVVSALASLAVPVASIVDFDILNGDQPLRRIVESHRGDWTVFEHMWRVVKNNVESKEAFLGSDKFKQEVRELMDKCPSGNAVPKDILAQVKNLAKRASPWDNIKTTGLVGLGAGQPTTTCRTLLEKLEEIGIFVVPVGEMEGFCRSIGNHGLRWVEEALARDVARDGDLDAARVFVSKVIAYLRSKVRIDAS
jgi:energy-coupling factor transporter ATP-binding protein EcfA2